MTTAQRTVRLRESACWAAIGVLAQALFPFGMLFGIARFGSASMLGQYALALAIATPLSVFADRALRTIQATSEIQDIPIGDYLSFRVAIGGVGLAITSLILTIGGYSWAACEIILLVTLLRMVEGIAQVFYGLMHQHEQMRMIAFSQILRAFFTLVAVLTIIASFGRLDVALAGGFCVQVAVVVLYDRNKVRQFEQLGRFMTLDMRSVGWRTMLRLTVPLGFATFLVSLTANMPRYLISAHWDEETLGVFCVLTYTGLPALMVVTACMQAAMPRLARLHRLEQSQAAVWMRLLFVSGGAGIINGAFVVWGGPTLLAWTLGESFSAVSTPLQWIVLAAAVGYLATVPATALTVQRRFRAVVVTCLISTTSCLFIGFLWIPEHGMIGAAWTMSLTSAIHGLVALAALHAGSTASTSFISNRAQAASGRP